MAVNISGDDGSLFWKAGIDTSDLDAGMKKITDSIQLSIKKQIDVQQQAAGIQKQLAQSILQSAGALDGIDAGFAKQIRNMAIFGGQVGKVSEGITQGVSSIQKQIDTLQGETLELKTKGFDVKPLTASLEALQTEVDRINEGKIEIKAGNIDLSKMLAALQRVQTEFDKLSQNRVKLDVDTSALKNIPPVFSQASVDAWKQQKQAITDAVQTYKFFYEQGSDSIEGLEAKLKALATHSLDLKVKGIDSSGLMASLDDLQQKLEKLKSVDLKAGNVDFASVNAAIKTIQEGIAKVSGQTIQLKIKDVDTASVQKAFDELQKRINSLKSAELSVKVGDLDIDSISAALQRAKEQFQNLKDLSVKGSADIDISLFQEKYNKLLSEISGLEQQTVQLKVAGIDAEPLENDLAALKEALQAKPLEIPVQVKTGSLSQKTAELEALKKQYADLAEVDRNSNIGQGMVQNIQQLETEVEKINSAFLRVEKNAAGSLNEKLATLTRLKEEYAALSDVDRRSNIGKQMSQNIHNLDRDISKINGGLQQTEGIAKKVAVALGAYVSLSAGTNLIKDIARVRGEFQSLEVSFQVLLKSKEKADKLMAEVTQLAATTPFELKDVAAGAKQLLALGVEASKVTELLRRMGDIAAGGGVEIDRIIRAYGQVKALGRVRNEELLQLAEAGVPIYKELAAVLGVAEEKVGDMVNTGTVGFDKLEKVIVNLTDKGGMFAGMMAEQSKTLTGQLSNLSDAWNQMLNDIGKSSQGAFSGAISTATSLVNNYQQVLDILGALVAGYGAYRAALIATVALQKVAKEETIATALAQKGVEVATKGASAAQLLQAGSSNVLRGAWKTLNTVMRENPAVIVGSAIAALTFAIIKLTKETDAIQISMEGYNEELRKERDNLAEMVSKAQALAEGTTERKKAIEAINTAYGGYLPNLLKENATNQDLIKTYDILNGKIQEHIALKYKNQTVDSLNKNFNKSNDDLFQGLIDDVKASKGAAAAGQAVAESEKVIDRILQLQRKRDQLLSSGKTDPKIDLQIQEITRNFYKKFNIQQGFFDNVYGPLLDIANNRLQLEKGLKQVDEFFGSYAEGSKAAIAKASKGLQDYLKEKDFASVFSKALSLAGNQSDLDAIKSRLEADKKAINPNLADTEAKIRQVQALIDQVDAKLKLYDPNKKDKADAAAAAKEQARENKTNELLQQRADLIKTIQDLQDNASKVGQSKELSELDKINSQYDEILQKVDAYNRKATINNVAQIGQVDIDRINAARNATLSAEIQRQGAEDYKQGIEEQKKVFDQFESYKLQVGTEKASALFAEQTKGFASYIDVLKAELDRLANDNSKGGSLKKDFLNTELTKAVREQSERQYAAEAKNFKDLLELTTSFYEKRKAITDAYQKQRETLNKNASALSSDQYENALQALDKAQKQALESLENTATEASDIYDRLGKSTINFTKEQLKAEISALKAFLKTQKDLNPDLVIKISARIEDLEGIIHSADVATDHLGKFAAEGAKIGAAFDGLANSIQGLNEGLADSLHLVANLVTGIGNAAKAYKNYNDVKKDENSSFADKALAGAGLVSAAVGVVGGIVSAVSGIFQKAKQSRIDTENSIKDFYDNIFQGEFQITEQYRERQREQVKLNKLKVQGLEDEKKLLEQQKTAVQGQYNDILKQLEQQTAVIAQQPEKFGGFLGIGVKRRVREITESLAGKSYEQLEALFVKGQLTGKARELFEMLQKLKQEGADIDRMIEENKREMAQVFTGTTVDSLTDSIAQMFADGKTSAQDLADFFEKTMRDAALSIFKSKEIAKQMEAFFANFSAAAESDGILSAFEIEGLRKEFTDDMNALQKRFEQFKQVTGTSLSLGFGSQTASQANTLQSAIKGITEETGSVIAGSIGGLRMTAAQQLETAMQSLTQLQKIESNTAMTAQRLSEVVDRINYWYTTGVKVKF